MLIKFYFITKNKFVFLHLNYFLIKINHRRAQRFRLWETSKRKRNQAGNANETSSLCNRRNRAIKSVDNITTYITTRSYINSLRDNKSTPLAATRPCPLPLSRYLIKPLSSIQERWSRVWSRACYPRGEFDGASPAVDAANRPLRVLTSMATQDMICNASGTWNGLLWSRS